MQIPRSPTALLELVPTATGARLVASNLLLQGGSDMPLMDGKTVRQPILEDGDHSFMPVQKPYAQPSASSYSLPR
jgi:hypothetical protein